MPLQYRLALDLGPTSIGWAALRLDRDCRPCAVIRAGVRIFGDGRDPQSKASLAVNRREKRAARRTRARRQQRKAYLLDLLVGHGLLPEDLARRRALVAVDPFDLRRRGLDEALQPAEFGRALFHLAQRRGFKSNRRTDAAEDDASAMKAAIAEVKQTLVDGGYRTVGEWLADRHGRGESVKARRHGGTKASTHYDLYIDRALVEDEFDLLWDTQAKYSPGLLNDRARADIHRAIFHQRPLKDAAELVGRCTLEPDERRAPLALPSIQRLRILQELNNLRIVSPDLSQRPLTLHQRDLLAADLGKRKEVAFTSMAKKLHLAPAETFNLAGPKRDRLKGDGTAAVLANKARFGAAWHAVADQDAVVGRLLSEQDEDVLVAWLRDAHGLTEEQARSVSGCRLPAGYGRLSLKAAERIIPVLEAEVVPYAEAATRAYGTHSALSHIQRTGELLPELPYYARVLRVAPGTGAAGDEEQDRLGRIANPTVHIALNQVRQVVNDLIGQYGPPAEVVVEVTRELRQSPQQRRETERDQAQRQQRNEAARAELEPILGRTPTRQDVQKYQLWLELADNPAERRCPYTGQQISVRKLFSPTVQVEHILPFAATLDDSLNNKTVSIASANRDKGNRTPFEAFGHSPDGYDYDAILHRASLMPRGKAYRFAADGMQRWQRDDADFLARALNDTAYLARSVREYLTCVSPAVWAIPGRLTGMVRNMLGLNTVLSPTGAKTRDDHRHHAVDACVIGVMDRAALQAFATANSRGLVEERLAAFPEPWPGYRDHVARAVAAVRVSHKPDHGHQRQLANDTIYGLRPGGRVALRRALDQFDTADKLVRADFADPYLKGRLMAYIGTGDVKQRIAQFTAETGIRRARVLEAVAVEPVGSTARTPRPGRRGPDGQYRGLKGDSNYCIEIRADDTGRWVGTVVSTMEAYARSAAGTLHDPDGDVVMRIFRGDVLRLRSGDGHELMRVCTISSNSSNGAARMSLAAIQEANVDARDRDRSDGFTYLRRSAGSLQAMSARKVTVSPAGRVTVLPLGR